jgi:hypothetical protein
LRSLFGKLIARFFITQVVTYSEKIIHTIRPAILYKVLLNLQLYIYGCVFAGNIKSVVNECYIERSVAVILNIASKAPLNSVCQTSFKEMKCLLKPCQFIWSNLHNKLFISIPVPYII